jgi:NAD(P)-dependent dehydrogenase (short-subunit alcohol dehydrogenase family)
MSVGEYFRDKVCVVTGAASGIGFALSEALLQAGAVVLLADLDAQKLVAAVTQLSAHAGRVYSTPVDVTNEAQVQQMVEGTAARHGRLDLLFNNAGIGGTAPIEVITLEHWRRIIDINLWGVIYGVHYALPIMRKQGGGHIVNTASIAGLIPPPFQALYCATKYAVVGLSESLRFELADESIHFTVVCPANVATGIFGSAKPPEDAISAEEAAQITLEGVAHKQGIIAFPEKYRQMWRRYWSAPEAFESDLRDTARQRRSAFQSKGNYY